MEQNLKVGADINCVVIDNKIENESKCWDGKELQLNNFLYLSLKNSLIKGQIQKKIDPYYKRNNGNTAKESFETNIILGNYLKILLI